MGHFHARGGNIDVLSDAPVIHVPMVQIVRQIPYPVMCPDYLIFSNRVTPYGDRQVRAAIGVNDVRLEVRHYIAESPDGSEDARKFFLRLAREMARIEITIPGTMQEFIQARSWRRSDGDPKVAPQLKSQKGLNVCHMTAATAGMKISYQYFACA